MMTTIILFFFSILLASTSSLFTISNNQFMINNKPIRILSGNMHYFRTPPEYWEENLDRLLSLGFNAVEFYIPWNYHETEYNVYDFTTKGKNVTYFLEIIKDRKMYALIRPGPYVCGEWEFGGFPAWLLSNGTIQLRTYAEPYISHVTKWFDVILPQMIKPFLYVNDAEEFNPILMVQVENEYGSYGDVSTKKNDAKYLQYLIDLCRKHLGSKVTLYTTDGGNVGDMTKGTFNDSQVLSIGDGCNNATSTWNAQKRFNPTGKSPFLCSEMYTGWLTHWGENYSAVATKQVVKILEQVLQTGEEGYGSTSLYMAFGGTNFGYWSGANGNGGSGSMSSYRSVTTSYDYNAPISEGDGHGVGLNGEDKYLGIQTILKKYAEKLPLPPEPSPRMIRIYDSIMFKKQAKLLSYNDALSSIIEILNDLVPMELLACYYGFILYSTTFLGCNTTSDISLSIPGVQDRGLIFIDGNYIGQISRQSQELSSLKIEDSILKNGSKFSILVVNEGRIGYSRAMIHEQKGIIDNKILLNNGTVPFNTDGKWKTQCIPLLNSSKFINEIIWDDVITTTTTTTTTTAINGSNNNNDSVDGPMFFHSTFISNEADDTFLNMEGWKKGQAWVNGNLLGRYWSQKGPQQTLYVPAAFLNVGENNVTILELFHDASCCNQHMVTFSNTAIYKEVV
jgi:hypothetical protein